MKKKCFCSTWWVKFFLVVTRTHYFFKLSLKLFWESCSIFSCPKTFYGGAKRFFSNLFHTVQCISWMWLCSWKNTKQKHIFLQPKLLCNIDTNSCFLRIASRPPVRIFNKIYTQHLNGYDEATYKISFHYVPQKKTIAVSFTNRMI